MAFVRNPVCNTANEAARRMAREKDVKTLARRHTLENTHTHTLYIHVYTINQEATEHSTTNCAFLIVFILSIVKLRLYCIIVRDVIAIKESLIDRSITFATTNY